VLCKRYEALKPFEHYDHGKDADPALPNLLKDGKVVDLTGSIGAEVTGVQLSALNEAGKNELALLVAKKKVVGKSHAACISSLSPSKRRIFHELRPEGVAYEL
jgi:hypothetical protein